MLVGNKKDLHMERYVAHKESLIYKIKYKVMKSLKSIFNYRSWGRNSFRRGVIRPVFGNAAGTGPR